MLEEIQRRREEARRAREEDERTLHEGIKPRDRVTRGGDSVDTRRR